MGMSVRLQIGVEIHSLDAAMHSTYPVEVASNIFLCSVVIPMLICPYCRSVNPQHHNFCQSCGRSLKHHVCHSCGNNVEFDLENCPQCQAPSGVYWWAVIEPAERPISVPVDIASDLAATADNLPTSIAPSIGQIVPNPWDSTDELVPAGVVSVAATDLAVVDPDESEIDPWDSPQSSSDSPSVGLPLADLDLTDSARLADPANPTDSSGALATTSYLDDRCRYRLLDPVVIQLLTPYDSSQVRVIDRQPFSKSSLEILMEQEPVTLDSLTVNRKPEEYRQWQFWNTHGIPKVAQAYIALQVSLPGTIPAIHDGWDDDRKTVTIVEDRHNWTQLADRWNDPNIPSSQTIYWLDYTLKLWVALEPWQMRQSILEVANLLLDEDARICFQRLYPERPDRQLKLADLANLWHELFDRATQPPSPSLTSLVQAMKSGEIERVEEVRSRLQQIAYELEPKQLSAPLQSSGSADLSMPVESPTFAIAQRLLDLDEAAATHTGRKRDHNEDCFGIVSRIDRHNSPKGKSISGRGLYILCDGMGGHAGGEIASAMTVDLLRDYFDTRWGDTLPDEQTIREGIVAANEAVFKVNEKNSASGSGRMGTTLVLVLVQEQNIAVAHVGDSRCYGITPTQGLIQLTLDHEVGQQDILRGVDPEIAYGRPDSYQLTQAIGPRDRNYIAPDIRFFELQEDTLILLASDGLTDNQLLENYWLTNVAPLLSVNANLQQGVDRLIDFANEYNGHDNITAIVVRAKMG
jgi:protein phosphatase